MSIWTRSEVAGGLKLILSGIRGSRFHWLYRNELIFMGWLGRMRKSSLILVSGADGLLLDPNHLDNLDICMV